MNFYVCFKCIQYTFVCILKYINGLFVLKINCINIEKNTCVYDTVKGCQIICCQISLPLQGPHTENVPKFLKYLIDVETFIITSAVSVHLAVSDLKLYLAMSRIRLLSEMKWMLHQLC